MRAAAIAAGARRLTAAEWGMLAEGAALACAVEIALQVVPLARILRVIEGQGAGAGAGTSKDVPLRRDMALRNGVSAVRIARLARWPSRVLPLPATCLRVALVQVAMLRRRGVPASVQFGVRRAERGELEVHAWADCEGPLDDAAGAEQFGTFEPVTVHAISRSARWSPPAAPTGFAR